MDSLVSQALRAGRGAPVPPRRLGERVLLVGAAGALGAAVLEHLLGAAAFVEVAVLVNRRLNAALHGLTPVLWTDAILAANTAASGDRGDEHPLSFPRPFHSAVVVFDRERLANGREQAFWRPDPAMLPALARRLKASGVRHLVLVQPHVSAGLPQALRLGLANLDEQGLAQLGFEHLVFMRPAQAPRLEGDAHPGHRLARWMLSQLQLMVPAQDKPVRSDKVARFAAQIAAGLPSSPSGARVVPADLVWEAAQRADSATLAADWLAGRPLRPQPPPRMRL